MIVVSLFGLPSRRRTRLLHNVRTSFATELTPAETWQFGTIFVYRLANGMALLVANALSILFDTTNPALLSRGYVLTCERDCPFCATGHLLLPTDHPHRPLFYLDRGVWRVRVWCPSIVRDDPPIQIDVPWMSYG